uniref:succinylglutamate desuccinylase/aspartoacylase family protein n=4 Tax=Hyphomicrobiales TaxID=356 RepID=UPI0004638808
MANTFNLDIDLDGEGRQDGYLRVKASSEHSPFGMAMVPITSFKSGAGPCVLVMGGCHGDEYEGQLIARALLGKLDLSDVTGQLIVMPSANPHAVAAGRRYSPLDDGNLNTAFPGSTTGTSTQRIAHFIETVLLPRADLVIDMHSGGTPVDYIPSVMISNAVEGARRQRLIELVRTFGLPVAFFVDDEDQTPSSVIGACDRTETLNITLEIGGGGSVARDQLDVGMAGLLRTLEKIGVLNSTSQEEPGDVAFMRRLPVSATICAPESGLFEPIAKLGETVEREQLAGLLYHREAPWREPLRVVFPEAGLVLCRRLPVMVDMGAGRRCHVNLYCSCLRFGLGVNFGDADTRYQ